MQRLRAAEQTTTYEYDAFDRLSTVGYDNGASLTYTYDEAGNRKSEIGKDPSAPTVAVKRFLHLRRERPFDENR